MTRWLATIALVGMLSSPVHAQRSSIIALEVEEHAALGDPESLRSAIEHETAITVRLTSEGEAELRVSTEGASLVVRYRRDEHELVRRTEIPASVEETRTVVALLVASLTADGTRDLLAELRMPEPVSTAPVPASAAANVERPELTAGIDFLPFLGTSTQYQGGELRHASLGILGDLYGALDGYALGGIFTLGGRVRGVQQAGLLTYANRLQGAQLSFLNIAGESVDGVQIGAVNVAGGPVRGAQIGFLNIGERADAGIGFLNFYSQGRTDLEVRVDSSGFLRTAVKHGSGPMHSIYGIGTTPFYGDVPLLVGLGIGLRAELDPMVFIDFDADTHYMLIFPVEQRSVNVLGAFHVIVGLQPIPELAIVLGVGYTVHTTSDVTDPLYAFEPIVTRFLEGSDLAVRGWPDITLGVQLF